MSSNYLQDQYQVQAVLQKPIKYLENVWGQDIHYDIKDKNVDKEMSFWPKFGRDRLNTGSLPYYTSPKLKRTPFERIIPIDTRISRPCWNETLAQSGPFYLRYWQIWDNASILPTTGDISKDPRYGENTRQFTKPYRTSGF